MTPMNQVLAYGKESIAKSTPSSKQLCLLRSPEVALRVSLSPKRYNIEKEMRRENSKNTAHRSKVATATGKRGQ